MMDVTQAAADRAAQMATAVYGAEFQGRVADNGAEFVEIANGAVVRRFPIELDADIGEDIAYLPHVLIGMIQEQRLRDAGFEAI